VVLTSSFRVMEKTGYNEEKKLPTETWVQEFSFEGSKDRSTGGTPDHVVVSAHSLTCPGAQIITVHSKLGLLTLS
jgi:hypothetical protein